MDSEKHIYRGGNAPAQAPISGTPGRRKVKRSKKQHRRAVVAVLLIFLLALAAVFAALYFTGLWSGISSLLFPPASYEYAVADSETLLRYLGHSSLKSGDTLAVSGELTVDVEADLGGFAELPLVNWSGSGSVRFSGGTVVLLGGNGGSVSMNGVSFDGCDLYIEAPKSKITWNSPCCEEQINCASLNGSGHARTLALTTVGSRFETEVTFTNVSGSALENTEVTLSCPNYIFVTGKTFTVDSLAAGATAKATVEVIATAAGRAQILATAYSAGGAALMSGSSAYKTILGNGYYAGDPHTHTAVSEHGNSSSLTENISSAWSSGMSWIGSVENCLPAQQLSQEQVDGVTGEAGAFLQVTGVENGEGVGTRHLLAYGTDVIAPSNYKVDPYDGNTWLLQDAVDLMTADGGIVVLPHFFTNYDISDSISISRSLRDVGVMELFYGGLEVGSSEYRVSMNIWNNLNVRGRQRMYAIGCANYGSADYIGTRYTKGYMTSLTERAFLEMLEGGNCFVTNGPELSFRIGSASMGGEIAAAADDKALCRISASDDVPLVSVVLYKYVVTGVIDNEIKEEVLSVDLSGQGVCSYTNAFELPLDSTQNCYYRLEVVSEKANRGDDQGLAFSNPIWTSVSEKSGDALFYAIEAGTGATLSMSDDGTYYVSAAIASVDSIKVTADENAMVTVDYHRTDSDAFADYITVRVIAQNGTAHNERIYIA